MKDSSFVKYLVISVLCGFWLGGYADVPSGYYNSLEGKSGVTLKKAVKAVARNHTAISYGDDTWEVFKESDTRYVGNNLVWWDMYSNNNVAVSSGHPGMNIEHSVANSWWNGTKNDAYKDLMHLNPSDSEANNRKSNYPLGIVATQTWGNGVTFVGKPKSGTCGGANYVYEPVDEYKGDFARAFFYMFTIYDDIAWKADWSWMYDVSSELLLKPWAYEMLLEWAEKDPVSQKEIDRNNAIYKHQKNRNPFIDCPQLAEHIWGIKRNTPFHLDGSVDPGTDPDPDDPGTDPGTPDTPEHPGADVPSGYWYAVSSAADLNETDYYVIVATTDEGYVMSDKLNGKYFEPCGRMPSFDKSVSPARISTVPDDAAVIKLIKSGAGWILDVYNLSGNSLGYLASTSAKTVTLNSSPSASGTTASITASTTKTDISYGSAGKLLYNVAAPRFLTYTSDQKPVRLYRLEAERQPGTNGIESTGIEDNADEVIYGIFDINGRRMNTSDPSLLDSGIYIVISNFGTKKILK